MIISFSVQNFRSIRDKVTLDFRATADKHQEEYFVVEIPKPKMRVLKMAMIYGANASGKTNILMALDFLKYIILFEPLNKNTALPRESHALDKEKPTIFSIVLLQAGLVYEYEMEIALEKSYINKESLYHYPLGNKALVFERQLIDLESFSYKYNWRGADLSVENKQTLKQLVQNKSVIAGIGSIQYNGPINEVRNWFLNTLKPLVKPQTDLFGFCLRKYMLDEKTSSKLKKLYISQLQSADFNIVDLITHQEEYSFSDAPDFIKRELIERSKLTGDAVNNDNKVINASLSLKHSSDESEYLLDFADESLGTQRYFGFIGLLIELSKDRIVSVDEIESSLHIDLLIHFIVTFLRNTSSGQLIFTSHNTALLNEKEILRRDAIWITDQKVDGSTELTSVSDYPVRKEHAIDSLYRKGLLGGIPNLGSTILDDEYEAKSK